jgi:nucleotide-binding universal stress UspA family protein
MFREILVPLDGSRVAETAIPVAAAIAARHQSRLHLVAVHRPIVLTSGLMLSPEVPLSASAELDRIAHEQLVKYVAQWEKTIAEGDGLNMRAVVLDGTAAVADQLLRYTESTLVDLVVMHTHARGVVGRMWLGSVANGLVQHGGIPCLLLRGPRPGSDQEASALPLRPRRILVPLDGSEEAELGVDFAMAMVVDGLTELRLLGVVSPFPFANTARQQGDEHAAQLEMDRYLGDVAVRVRAQAIPVQTRSVLHLNPASAILDNVAEWEADLVSVAASQRGRASRIFLGSVIDFLLRRSTVPMLVWRNRELAGTTLLPPPHGEE